MNVVIVEDENAAARRLEKMLLEIDPGIHVIQRLDSVESTVLWARDNPAPDLLFLDIQLADGVSFEIFDHIDINCPIIFTTAYDAYALQAFKVNTIDYLLKPIKQSELELALNKFKKNMEPAPLLGLLDSVRQQQANTHLKRMLIRLGNSLRLVEVDDAAYFYSKDKITFMVSKSSAKRLPVDHPLEKLESLLDPAKFFRINRQVIINIHAIKEMHPYSKSRLKIELEPPADMDTIVSTERSAKFKRWLVGDHE